MAGPDFGLTNYSDTTDATLEGDWQFGKLSDQLTLIRAGNPEQIYPRVSPVFSRFRVLNVINSYVPQRGQQDQGDGGYLVEAQDGDQFISVSSVKDLSGGDLTWVCVEDNLIPAAPGTGIMYQQQTWVAPTERGVALGEE
jgi:hypothetical protein